MQANFPINRSVAHMPALSTVAAFCLAALVAIASLDVLAAQLVIQQQGGRPFGGKVVGDPAGGSIHCDHGYVEWQNVMLPELGIPGNTHFPMLDLNNVKIADLLSQFLKEHNLDRRR